MSVVDAVDQPDLPGRSEDVRSRGKTESRWPLVKTTRLTLNRPRAALV